MKSILKLFSGLAITLIVATCNDDITVEIEPAGEYELTANISVANIVKNFKDVNGADLFPNGLLNNNSRVVKVDYYVYKKSGSCIIDETRELQDFSKTTSITSALSEGDYTVVASAYVSDKNNEVEFWRQQTSVLNDHTIKYSPAGNYIGYHGVLGVWKETISIKKSETKTINIEPVVSMVCLNFTNCNLAGIKTLEMYVQTFNDYFDVANMQGNLTELNKALIYSSDGIGTSCFYHICYLPTSYFNISWTGFDANKQEIKSGVVPSRALKAGENNIITINTSQSANQFTFAECYYWGDYYGHGSANFNLFLYDNETNPIIEFSVEGFCNMPSPGTNFKLEAGTYSFANTFASKTIWPGAHDDECSYFYNDNTDEFILFTGGTMTVASSGNNYTITTAFSGKDYYSGASVNNLNYTFTGPIDIINKTSSFNDIVKSVYTAIGTPYPVTPSAPATWAGEVHPHDDDGLYYEITKWANGTENMYLNYLDGKLVLDDNTKVGTDGDYDLYFFACYYSDTSGQGFFYHLPDYTVKYDKTTRTLDFSGTHEEREVYVGLWGHNPQINHWIVYTDTHVAGAKLILTPN